MKSVYQYVKMLPTKMIVATLVICFSMVGNSLYSQNPAWSLTPKYLITSPISLPTVSSIYGGYTGTPAKYNSNMQLDAQGNILFFVVDNWVFNKNGQAINELYSAASSPVTLYMQGNAEMLIVPDPGNCQRYYIIASADDNSYLLFLTNGNVLL